MYTIEKYNNDIALLAKSMVIKHHNIGVTMERYLAAGNPISHDYSTWKYYLNLAGLKHASNNDVSVRIIETDAYAILTPQLLIDYPATRRDLDLRQDSYNALLAAYPDDHIYINGCITPVDIAISTVAVDGSVIAYSSLYVEPQEVSIIRELSSLIIGFMERWYIIDYNITDELYMSSIWGILTSSLPGMIASLRHRSAGTSEAHSFHLEHFFRSHLDIWAGVSTLPEREKRWLYRNLVWLMNNTGTRDSLNTLIANVFTPAGIGLGNYELGVTEAVVNTGTGPYLPNFNRGAAILSRTGLNSQYRAASSYTDTATTVSKELMVTTNKLLPDAIALPTLVNNEKAVLDTTAQIKQPSKILDFGLLELFTSHGKSPLMIILDNWLVDAFTNKHVVNITFLNPVTTVTHYLDAKTGVMLFYYLLYTRLGVANPKLSTVVSNTILKSTITAAELLVDTLGGTGRQYAAATLTKLPQRGVTRTVEAYSIVISSLFSYYSKVWELDSNINNAFLSADIKQMVSKLYVPTTVVVDSTGATLQQLLLSNGIDVANITADNSITVMSELLLACTGHYLDETTVVKETYNNYKVLLDRLTSQATQTILPDVVDSPIASQYTTVSINKPAVGYIGITSATIDKILEDNPAVMTGAGSNQILAPQLVGRQTTPTAIAASARNLHLSATCRYSNGVAGVTRSNIVVELSHPGYNKFYPQVIGSGNQMVGNQVTAVKNAMPNAITPTNHRTGANINANIKAVPTANVTRASASAQIPSAGLVHYKPANTPPASNNTTGNTPTAQMTPTSVPTTNNTSAAPSTSAKATVTNVTTTKPSTTTTIK